jgi:tRNA(Ile)-lysidine synthase TilS/MesJ
MQTCRPVPANKECDATRAAVCPVALKAAASMSREHLSYVQQMCVKSVGRSMQRTDMIGPGARIGVAVSGGADSWVLLEVLRRRQRIVPFRYEIMVLHLNPGFDPDNHAPLLDWLAKFGVSSHVEVTDHGPRGHSEENRKNSACFYCARLRRKRLFELCRQYTLSHLAFGHNADDLASTFFMNLLQNGRVDGLSMKDAFFQGRLTIIRPLILIEKSDIIRAARQWKLPVWHNPCPSAGHTRRAAIENFVRDTCGQSPLTKKNLFNGLRKWQLQLTQNAKAGKIGEETKKLRFSGA